MASEPSTEDIRLRAYHRYLERGQEHGADVPDPVHALVEHVIGRTGPLPVVVERTSPATVDIGVGIAGG